MPKFKITGVQESISPTLPEQKMDYYRDALHPSEKHVYDQFYRAVLAGNSSAAVAGILSSEQMSRVIQAISDDHPELFYVDFSGFSSQIGLGRSVWNIRYIGSRAGREAAISGVEDRIREALRQMGLTGRESAAQIYRRVHNYLCQTVTYNYGALRDEAAYPEAFTIAGALERKSAVCEGIAKAFKVLCERAGVKDVLLMSGMSSCEGVGESLPHAWNIVRTARGWAHVDVTWDLCLTRPGLPRRYDYFLIPDSWMRTDHTYTCRIPCEDQTESYFVKNHCLISGTRALETYLKNGLRADARCLYFKITGENPISENTVSKVQNMTAEAIRRYVRGSCSVAIYMNADQHTYLYVIQQG